MTYKDLCRRVVTSKYQYSMCRQYRSLGVSGFSGYLAQKLAFSHYILAIILFILSLIIAIITCLAIIPIIRSL